MLRFVLNMTTAVISGCLKVPKIDLLYHKNWSHSGFFLYGSNNCSKVYCSHCGGKHSKQKLCTVKPKKAKIAELLILLVFIEEFFFPLIFGSVTLSEAFPFVSNVTHKAADTGENPRGRWY